MDARKAEQAREVSVQYTLDSHSQPAVLIHSVDQADAISVHIQTASAGENIHPPRLIVDRRRTAHVLGEGAGRSGPFHVSDIRTSPHPTEVMDPDRMRRQRQQGARSPSRELVAYHRLPDKTELVAASDDAEYTDVWNAASKLSRSRRVFSAAPEPAVQPRHPRLYASSRHGTMRVDVAEVTDSPYGGRRMSNAGSELGDWINKYQKSDHHADRLVRTIVQYEQTTGQRFPGTYHHQSPIRGDCFSDSYGTNFCSNYYAV